MIFIFNHSRQHFSPCPLHCHWEWSIGSSFNYARMHFQIQWVYHDWDIGHAISDPRVESGTNPFRFQMVHLINEGGWAIFHFTSDRQEKNQKGPKSWPHEGVTPKAKPPHFLLSFLYLIFCPTGLLSYTFPCFYLQVVSQFHPFLTTFFNAVPFDWNWIQALYSL